MTELSDFFAPPLPLRFRPEAADASTPRVAATPAAEAAPPATSAISGVQWRQRYEVSLRITDSVIIAGIAFASSQIIGRQANTAVETNPGAGSLFAAAVAVVWIVMLAGFRTRDARLFGVGVLEYKRVVHASAATFGGLAVVVVLTEGHGIRDFFLFTFPAGLVALVISRWVWRNWLTRQRAFGHFLSKVVVVGQLSDVEYVMARIAKTTGAVYDVVGAVIEGRCSRGNLGFGGGVIPLTQGLGNVEAAVQSTGADAVIVAGQLHKGGSYIRELGWNLERTGTELVVASSLTNVAGPRIQVRPVEGLPLMHVELPQFTGGRHLMKRAIDIAASGLALIVLMPVLAVLASLVIKDSPGSALFRQYRVGRQGSTFVMYKFRSMVTNAESELEQLKSVNEGNAVLFKLHNDPRVTRTGRWMRKYSLDELPQLWNVFKGDMSLVGPRPPLPEEVSTYNGHTHRRLYIKPGLTGLWQINGRSDLDWQESVRLDLYYVENWSVTGDLMIMWRTLKVMLQPEGAY